MCLHVLHLDDAEQQQAGETDWVLGGQVDPSLIGGVVIDIGDKHIDLSIASRIKKIQQLVLQNV